MIHMGFWTKKSDWLPLSNAKAQVDFYRQNLDSKQKYLTYVETFKDKNLPGYRKIYSIALRDVTKAEDNLKRAQKKLEETIKRDGLN